MMLFQKCAADARLNIQHQKPHDHCGHSVVIYGIHAVVNVFYGNITELFLVFKGIWYKIIIK